MRLLSSALQSGICALRRNLRLVLGALIVACELLLKDSFTSLQNSTVSALSHHQLLLSDLFVCPTNSDILSNLKSQTSVSALNAVDSICLRLFTGRLNAYPSICQKPAQLRRNPLQSPIQQNDGSKPFKMRFSMHLGQHCPKSPSCLNWWTARL